MDVEIEMLLALAVAIVGGGVNGYWEKAHPNDPTATKVVVAAIGVIGVSTIGMFLTSSAGQNLIGAVLENLPTIGYVGLAYIAGFFVGLVIGEREQKKGRPR